MNKQYAYFSDLPVGTEFIVHGNACKKISTRTASIDSPIAAGTFYYRNSDLCIVGRHTRLSADYFGGKQ